ncbi:hypothetical protein VTO42DRAFT_6015 [Malbranchea cinnamomea]
MEEIVRGICGQDGCRERRYHIENGIWFCRQGHQQEGRQVVADDDDFGTQGRTVRQKRVASEKVSKVYSGSKAYQLFLEAYQLILWKQCYALIHEKGLPQELEAIVKDLWTLRLHKLYERSDENYLSDDKTTQVFSSQTELSTAVDEEEQRYHRKKLSDSPKIIDSLGLCYLGILLLRIPVSIGYIQRWILRDEVPFLRAIRFVPDDMKARLPSIYHVALETKVLPTGDQFHRAVSDLVMLYNQDFGVSFPPINSSLLLFSYIKQLALPLEVFPAVRHLQSLIGYTFSFSDSIVGRFHRIYLPEVQLISLVVIVTKLLYPLDDVKRYPYSWKDPAAQAMNWDTWVRTQTEFEEKGRRGERLRKGEAISVSESDAFRMAPQQLDDYMDWYEKMWIDKQISNSFADMFPTDRIDGSNINDQDDDEENAISEKLRVVLSNLKIRKAVAKDPASPEFFRPGDRYKRYRSENELHGKAKALYQAAAKIAGTSLRTLVLAVYMTERKFQDSTPREPRRSMFRKTSESEDEDEDTDIGETTADFER